MWRLSHCHSNTNFNPRSPHGERLLILSICTPPVVISIHAPRTGSDDLLATSVESLAIFQSTLPARGATFKGALAGIGSGISIHAPRTGSDVRFTFYYMILINISIHAPRTGSDALKLRLVRAAGISIHAPRTGSDKSRRVR